MKSKILNICSAILAGVSIPIIPYSIFVILINRVGEENFNLSPGFISVQIGLLLLCLGGYITGKILSKGNYRQNKNVIILLTTPGLYIGVGSFMTSILLEVKIPKDGIIALSLITVGLMITTTFFSFLGYRKRTK